MADPAKWLLPFATGGEGRPWGDGTAIAARLAQGDPPWDVGNKVTSLIGGFEATVAIREAVATAIAGATGAPGQKGHVYIAGWRFNALRDLSDQNPWLTHAWNPGHTAVLDQTAIALVFRLMQAGVRVRIAVWMPTFAQSIGAGDAHIQDHRFLAHAVKKESDRLAGLLSDPLLGVVALDLRTAEGSIAGAHHQKTMVFRGPAQNIAFCGGVDLAFTRRDAPSDPTNHDPSLTRFLGGDWQSDVGIPPWVTPPHTWPRDGGATTYDAFDPPSTTLPVPALSLPTDKQAPDIPSRDPATQKDIYGFSNHIWHDQHLKLEGPIVQTLEDQFRERWIDSAPLYDLSNEKTVFGDQVVFSSPWAIGADKDVDPLPPAAAATVTGGSSPIQMWRTIPWRDKRKRPPFRRAEFTAMAGVNRAVQAAEHVIWIFDQYFWSLPLARQLNFELKRIDRTDLRVIVILPPYADTRYDVIHEARRRALTELAAGGLATGPAPRVAVYGLWDPRAPNGGRGIYCHAKVQMFDGSLLACGSANMNRRSFVCDSELAVAVADEAVVAAHQQRLWELLFADVPGTVGQWPGLDLDAAGSGAAFFDRFTEAAADTSSHLRPDQWALDDPELANGVVMPRAWRHSPLADFLIDHIFDPSSLDVDLMERDVVTRDVNTGAVQSRPARLDDVVQRIEKTERRGNKVVMPNRRQNSVIRTPDDDVEYEFNL
jgi:phosphatidylserine/phosphatidylglycerophosphate/cardiolipin synthase-like enzyme